MKRISNKNGKIRSIVQLLFFFLIAAIATNHTLSERGTGFGFIPNPSLHSICPFGGVVSIYQFITTGTFVQKIHQSSFVLMGVLIIISIAFGAAFCGWICPFGTFQEWLGKLGKRLFGKKYNNIIPEKIDRYLRYLRYIVLAWVIYVTAVTGKLVFGDIDPYHALFNFWSGEVTLQALAILIVIALASLIIERPWCKYTCPLGALIGIFNIFRFFKIKRNEATCISCSNCDRACPMGIKVSESKIIRDHQCISCMECTSDLECPVADTVEFSLGGGKQNANQA